MAVIEKFLLGNSVTQILTTALNSLANNGLVLSALFDNTIGAGGGDGYTLCDVELLVTYGSAPTANTGCTVWFISSVDGTNYEDGDASTTPAKLPSAVFPLRAVTTAQRIAVRVFLPWGKLKVLIKNDGTGQAMASSGNILSIRPVTREAV